MTMRFSWNPCCFCCIKLKTGALVVAVAEIILYTLGIIVFSLVSSMLQIMTDAPDDKAKDGDASNQVSVSDDTTDASTNSGPGKVKHWATFHLLFTLNALCFIGVIGGIFLVFAVKKMPTKVSWLFRGWAVIKVLQVLGVASLLVADQIMKIWQLPIYYFVIWGVIKLYMVIVIFSHFHKVQSKLAREERAEQAYPAQQQTQLLQPSPKISVAIPVYKDESTETEPVEPHAG